MCVCVTRQRAAVVDGNITRVLSRMRAIGADIGCRRTVDHIWYADVHYQKENISLLVCEWEW